MAADVNVSSSMIPLFKGENYQFWSIKMKTLLKSQGLWELVDAGTPDPDLAPLNTAKRDAKALFFIQQAVHDSVFVKISAAETSKEAWTILKTAFQGSSKVVAIKLQGLRREFETLSMNPGESVQAFLSRVTSVVNQIRSCGEDLEEKIVVMKVLRSLTTKFDHVVATIEESKDLSTYTFDELMGSLQVHEARLNQSEARYGIKAFYTNGKFSNNQQHGGGRGQGSRRDVECYYCHKKGHVQARCYKKQRDEGHVECSYCHKFGHMEADCYKKKREEKQVNFVEEEDN